jgi:hypothetical protein
MGQIRWRYDNENELGGVLIPEHVPYGRFVYGYGADWSEVPWVAYRHFMWPADVVAMFGDTENVREVIEYNEDEDNEDSSKLLDHGQDIEQPIGSIPIWEIWDRAHREVLFIAEAGCEEPLKRVKDPLGLKGFFPSPRPLYLDRTPGKTDPVPMYRIYSDLAIELNEVSRRISRLVNVCKFRGVYDPLFSEVGQIFDADETIFIPAGEDGVLADRGLDKAIWTVPIDTIVSVIAELITQREQLKAVIYDVTGLADILRGVSDPRETATAQNLKQQNAAGRLAQYQQAVAHFARDNVRLVGEYSAEHYSPKKLQEITLLPYPTKAEKDKAIKQFQQEQALYQKAPPELQKILDEKGLTPQEPPDEPTWEDIHDLLKSPRSRELRIDIETNSTIAEDYDRELEDVQNLLNGIADMVGKMFPAVQAGMIPADVIKELMLLAVRRARCGVGVEDVIQTIQQPEQPAEEDTGLDPAQIAQMQTQSLVEAQRADNDRLIAAGKLEIERMKLEQKQSIEEGKLSLKQYENQLRELELQLKQQEIEKRSFNDQLKILQNTALHEDKMSVQERESERQAALDREQRDEDSAYRAAEFGANRLDADRSHMVAEKSAEQKAKGGTKK